MANKERLEIAKTITKLIVQKYGNEILLVGVYGSVAKEEDMEFSDIDMYVITKNLSFQKYFAYKEIPITIHFKTKKEVLEIIRNVTSTWPAEVHKFLFPKVLYGSETLLDEFRQIVNKISKKEFQKAASTALIEIFENVGKVRNACKQRNLGRCIEAVWNVVWHAEMFVALINKKYYEKPGFRSLGEVLKFEKIPEKYCELVKTLWTSKDFDELSTASMELWKNCLKLAKKEGIKFENYTSLNETKL